MHTALPETMPYDQEEISKLVAQVQKDAQAQIDGDQLANSRLQESVRNLSRVAQGPEQYAKSIRFQTLQNVCLLMAQEMQLLHYIVEANGQPLTARELAKRAKYEELLICRVMRMIVAMGIVDEAGEDLYRMNSFTEVFIYRGQCGGMKHSFELMGAMIGKVIQYMRETGFVMFPDDASETSIFEYSHGSDVWGKLRKDREHKRAFDDLMTGRRMGIKSHWYETFPAAEEFKADFSHESDAVMLVDVAGNQGHDLYNFKMSAPDLPGRLILEDLPETLNTVEKSSIPGIEIQEYDFFTPQPIKGARAYYFRNICHDWSDEKSKEFLSNTAKAMKRGYSTLLIDDLVLPPSGATLRGVSADIQMMFLTTGIERTLTQWEALLDAVGLEIVKVWGAPEGGESIIETRLSTESQSTNMQRSPETSQPVTTADASKKRTNSDAELDQLQTLSKKPAGTIPKQTPEISQLLASPGASKSVNGQNHNDKIDQPETSSVKAPAASA